MHDLDWQRAEYERLMGEERAERQAEAAAREQGRCVKRRGGCRTVKVHGLFYTLHASDCPRWKPWMPEIEEQLTDRRRATDAHVDAVRPTD